MRVAAWVLLVAAGMAGRVLAAEEPLRLDTHLDTPIHFGREGWDVMKRHSYRDDMSQVDYPRMVAGGLDGGFFVLYTPQGPLTPHGYAAARDWALMRATHIHEMVAAHPDSFALATSAADAPRLKAAGKRVVFISIENSYPLGTDLTLLETFRRLGVRMAGPVHFLDNQFGDSATDKPKFQGLSPLGRAWVVEMNRLGLIIDASHASDAVFDQLLDLSRTPIILSHSGCRAVFDHPRNLDDGRIRKLAEKGGVIQINSVYLIKRDKNEAMSAIDDRLEVIDQLRPVEQSRLIADYQAAADQDHRPRANFDLFMRNLLHALEIAGPDHVGIGADWDGGGGVDGHISNLRKKLDLDPSLPSLIRTIRGTGYMLVPKQD